MARLWTSGFELQSSAANVEFDSTFNFAIAAGAGRGGGTAGHVNITNNSAELEYQFADTSGIAIAYYRVYIYLASTPSTTDYLLFIDSTVSAGDQLAGFKLNNDRTLNLFGTPSGTIIGSASSPLSLNTWYRVELKVDMTTKASTVIEGRINGTSFASGTVNLSLEPLQNRLRLEFGYASNTTVEAYLDDIAINDSSGSFQNSWPGDGKILHLRPTITGDSTQWTPDSGKNYARVNEITPDDASSYVASRTLNQEDLYNLADSGLAANVTVNLVSVGARFRNDVADAATAVKLELEKQIGGTKAQSGAIIPNSTTWSTNAVSTPHNSPLTLYQDPDGQYWEQPTLDTMQIGATITTGGTNNIQLSTIWALVEYNDVPIGINEQGIEIQGVKIIG